MSDNKNNSCSLSSIRLFLEQRTKKENISFNDREQFNSKISMYLVHHESFPLT